MTAALASASGFIELDAFRCAYLILAGFVGGLVSGFIGSGGAFVLTPAMMGLGVPGLVAVASNMCHKFPKALVGAIRRARYGQVDLKLGIVLGASAQAGVIVGARVQEAVLAAFGQAGSNLYVSAAFVVVLGVVGSFVLLDARRSARDGPARPRRLTRLARWVHSVHIPGTMMRFRSIHSRVSVLFTIPLGFATGMLAATIAVGGFVGVPSMMYVLGVPGLVASATELVVAFIMGMVGAFNYALSGLVDVRLALLILAGSLFGIHLGAIATTRVRPVMIKVVMGVVMIIVLFSRALMVPVYLSELGTLGDIGQRASQALRVASFLVNAAGLLAGAALILRALWKARRPAALRGAP
ncbi:MAG TPA: sulfite exporter TauE/SafE family protein [Phycisphaerae bacterium]|nr:sulfite exporter TauE/SafE family protein [Phycisphaerae bacterium]